MIESVELIRALLLALILVLGVMVLLAGSS